MRSIVKRGKGIFFGIMDVLADVADMAFTAPKKMVGVRSEDEYPLFT